ncbi:MAG: type II toxin-antitoxin system Phd/YefM family antitoxin [Planctomycetes bacterium]|nr:type II toxin-antitoxin system Phd/YefM family antitoxin [Planctomycetota bacterium]
MKTITFGVREFQAHIGDALRFVGAGARVVITSRGKPVAVLSQPGAGHPRQSALDRRITRLAAEGRLLEGEGGRIPAYTVPAVDGLTDQLLRDRG